MLFAERYGYVRPREVIQTEGMDDALRNGLWSAVHEAYFEPTGRPAYDARNALYRDLWRLFFKKPVDTIPGHGEARLKEVRNFFFECEWFDVYSLIEFLPKHFRFQNLHVQDINDAFRAECNEVLKRELGGYRFVGEGIAPITDEEEVASIEQALTHSEALPGVREHIREALRLLGDRQDPQYRNVIKESISAVESLCVVITGDKKATLGEALKVLDKHVEAHEAQKGAFTKLYGYTSDAEGIRHALLEKPTLDQEDAKFMLIACSAFINFLVAKAAKAGLDLTQKDE